MGIAAGGTAAERAAVERQYEVDEFVAATRRLVALYQRLHQVQARWVLYKLTEDLLLSHPSCLQRLLLLRLGLQW